MSRATLGRRPRRTGPPMSHASTRFVVSRAVKTRLRTLVAGALAGLLAAACAPGASDQPGAVSVRFDAGAAGTPISPLVYGVAGADAGVLARLGATLDRWGGNPSSTYNWAAGHDWNAGRDWEFRNANYTGSAGSAA